MIVTRFPRAVRVIEHALIPLKDGTRLAARIWLPHDAERNPVPAILEYLPYRKRDGTYERDSLTHPYLAGHGYAGVRVDIRGSGESDGVLTDEYSQHEQDDALDVIDWLASQPWCSGAVGMMGISWGGFNGLQVAAHMLKSLAIRSVRLMTNNPAKIRQLTQYGLRVNGRIPHVIPSNSHNRFYLETKANRSGHYSDITGKSRLPEQSDPVIVEGMSLESGT